VAASTHTWEELAPYVPEGPPAVLTAHERVVRGENLTDVALPGPPVLELPLHLEPWEPAYLLAEYRAHEADFPGPPPPRGLKPVEMPGTDAPAPRAHGEDVDALRGIATAWATGSGGRADAVAVEGPALAAVTGLGATSVRTVPLSPADAIATLAWAAASGGAHGRRAGAAPGRFAAWWVVAALGDLVDDWPVPPAVVGTAAGRLRWFAWDRGEPTSGWVVRLAVEDPASGRAWALEAHDPASGDAVVPRP
jgi:hypothetical protein